jgi:outer membrane biosynthesis protein TonB
MKVRVLLIAIAALGVSQIAGAANTPPLSEAWNIASTGTASSSGELLFRVTVGDSDPTEITVSVTSGTDEVGVAGNIRRALNTQLRSDRFDVVAGEGANVLVTSAGSTGFSLELVDSDVENIRVAVQSAQPAAPPTVPQQATPANPPATTPATPPAPGDVVPPPQPSLPVPQQPSQQQPSQPVPQQPSQQPSQPIPQQPSQQPSQPIPQQPSQQPSQPAPPQSLHHAPGETAADSTSPRLTASPLLPAPRFRYRFP